jgi:SAM-dependent methyltransferase
MSNSGAGSQITAESGERTLSPFSGLRRFLSDNPMLYKSAIAAAEAYVANLDPSQSAWLFAKPYDISPGSPQFFRLTYDVLNILQAMQLPAHSHILEVGSGPGWVTEILAMLGHSVESLEPSSDMAKIARERIELMSRHHHLAAAPKVTFHQGTMEEAALGVNRFDAVLFFDSLHHCVDEEKVIGKSFDCLKPGGCLAVVESAWHPDFKELEAFMTEEMRRFGTLENPLSTGYLDHLCTQSGFVDIERYVGVNGFFKGAQLGQRLENVADTPLRGSNNITARKPSYDKRYIPLASDMARRTAVAYRLIACSVEREKQELRCEVAITNTGETLLDNTPELAGHVTVTIKRGEAGSPDWWESSVRHRLENALPPGASTRMSMCFPIPATEDLSGLELDMICEGIYWLSSRGNPCLALPA